VLAELPVFRVFFIPVAKPPCPFLGRFALSCVAADLCPFAGCLGLDEGFLFSSQLPREKKEMLVAWGGTNSPLYGPPLSVLGVEGLECSHTDAS